MANEWAEAARRARRRLVAERVQRDLTALGYHALATEVRTLRDREDALYRMDRFEVTSGIVIAEAMAALADVEPGTILWFKEE